MEKKIREDLEKQFTLQKIDFYDNNEDVQTFIYYADEVSSSQADALYEDYEKKYNADQYNGAFEDYLKEQNIKYCIL